MHLPQRKKIKHDFLSYIGSIQFNITNNQKKVNQLNDSNKKMMNKPKKKGAQNID